MKKTIFAPSAPLYACADITGGIIDEVLFGMTCDIMDELPGFYKVRMEYGIEGYVEKPYVMDILKEPNMTIISSFADLLTGADCKKKVVMTLPKGALADVGFSKLFETYGFLVLPDKRVFYIHKKHIAPRVFHTKETAKKNQETLRQDIIDTALSYMGTQYRWGGKTLTGIDAFGLAFMSYHINGITLNNTAGRIDQSITPIPHETALPGDLLLFDGHIGIYLGENKYIHASAPLGIVGVNSLNPEDLDFVPGLEKNRLLCTGTVFI